MKLKLYEDTEPRHCRNIVLGAGRLVNCYYFGQSLLVIF